MFRKLLRLHDVVYQSPILGSLSAYAVLVGAKHVREILPDLSLVRQACEPARSWQNAKERKFRQADCGRAIIDEDDFVARQREFVSAACSCSIASGEKLQS